MTYNETIHYNATRDATFLLLSAVIAELANAKGPERSIFLQQMRTEVLERLDASRQQDLSREYDPMSAQVAEKAGFAIAAVFDVADGHQ